jgi:hypothetical protein
MIRNRNRNNEPLTLEQIQRLAPSAFAGQAHDSRSDRYSFVPTSAVIQGMAQNGFQVFQALQSRSRIPGKEFFTKHVLRFRSILTNSIISVGDTFAELVLTNSHDGTSAYELALGSFRLTCENGAMVSEGLVQSLKIRHTGNIIDAVVAGSEDMIAQAPKLVEAINLWKAIELLPTEQKILAEEAHSLRFEGSPVSAEVKPEALLAPRRYADNGNDLWSVYNRVQENVIKGGLRYNKVVRDENGDYQRTVRNRTRGVNSVSEDNKLNKALWSLAEKMAALKS